MFKTQVAYALLLLGLIGQSALATASTGIAPPRPTAAASVQETPKARISAQFLLPDGAPASGARWYVSGWQSNAEAVKLHGLPDDWETLRGTLDESGRIDLRFVPPQAYQFIFNVSAEGCGQASWRFGSIKPTEEKLLGKIELKKECPIVGRIVGLDGSVLSGQSWRIRARETQSGGFGDRDAAQTIMTVEKGAETFSVKGLPPGAVEIYVGGAGLVGEKKFTAVLKEGRSLERDFLIDLVVPKNAKITVSCSAKPFRSFHGPDLEHVKVVAADGTSVDVASRFPGLSVFSIESDAPGPFKITISDPRFEFWERDGVKNGERVRVGLTGTSSLKLDVRAPDGKPETAYSVELSAIGNLNPPVEVRKAGDPPGNGWLIGLVPAEYKMTVRSADAVARVPLLLLKANEKRETKVQLAARVMARGSVTFPSGEPAVGAEVILVRPAQVDDSGQSRILMGRSNQVPPTYRTRAGTTQCDADGAFELEAPEAGDYVLVAREAGKCWVMSDVVAVTQDGLSHDLMLPYGALLKGLVALPPHLPVDGWEVYLARDDYFDSLDQQWSAPRLDSEGAFQCVGVRPGPADVYIRQASGSFSADERGAPHGGYFVGSVLLEEGGAHETQLELEAAAAPSMVTPVVTSNRPLGTELTVILMDSDKTHQVRSSIVIRGSVDESESSFTPKMIAPGTYNVQIAGEDWAVFHHSPVSIEGGKPLKLPLNVKLRERRLLITRGGEPAAGAILLVTHGPWRPRSFQCDGEGYVTVSLDEGPFKFHLQLDVRRPVEPGGKDVVFPLEESTLAF